VFIVAASTPLLKPLRVVVTAEGGTPLSTVRWANVIGTTPFPSPAVRSRMSIDTTGDGGRELDVREIDGEPFGDIMSALEDLPADETLTLVNSFEPVPLYEVLERKGYTHDTTQVDDDLWRVEIAHA